MLALDSIFHGGGLDTAITKFGGEKSDWLDLSTGINPNPYSNLQVDVASLARLPDTGAMDALLKAACDYYMVGTDAGIVAANGTQALIELLPKVFEAKRVGIIAPTYAEHAHVWKKSGAEIIEIISADVLPKSLDVLVVVNPNNPTGESFKLDQLLAYSKQLEENNGLLIVDEAFCDAVPDLSLVGALPQNTIVLKSVGKFFGLAGLRLGFAISSEKIINKMQQHMGPWGVNGAALEIGTRALKDFEWQNATIGKLKRLSKFQAQILQNAGLKIAGSNALFHYVEHEPADKIYKALAKQHILLRKFEERKNYLRFGLCRDEAQLARLETVLTKVMANA